MGEERLLEMTLRPQVPMPYVQAVAPLAALAICEQLGPDAEVFWPAAVLLDGTEIAHVSAKAGYDEGMFVALSIPFAQDTADLARMEEAIRARADQWEQAVCSGRSAAGPLAPFASDYFDHLAGLGGTVELLFPNGNLYCRAKLEGIDVWGRICVETEDGRDVEYSPEQVSMRLI